MIISIKHSNNISTKILKLGAITATCIIPVVYMTKLHVDMFRKDDKQNRAMMTNKMLGFFAGIGLSVLLIHKRIKPPYNNLFIQLGKITLAAIAPFAGLELAKKVNKNFYPEKFKKSPN